MRPSGQSGSPGGRGAAKTAWGGLHVGINTLFLIPGRVGGTETYLIEILKELDRSSGPERFTVFTTNSNHRLFEATCVSDRWTLVKCPFDGSRRPLRIVREQLELPVRAALAHLDVLWSPGYTAPLLSACPQVVTIHDMQYKTFPRDFSVLARWAMEALVQSAARHEVITVSEFSRQEILRHTRTAPSRVHVTLEAADEAFALDVFERVPVERPYLLCVANTYPHKHVDQAVRAFSRMETWTNHDFVLLGRPDRGEADVQAAMGQLSDKRRLHRLSGLTRPQVVALYRGASAFVFPSRYEGFGLPVLEALTAGTPVITTRCASIPEVGGDVVEYYDCFDDSDLERTIKRVLSWEPAVKDAWRELVRAHCRRFTWASTARATLDVLRTTATRTRNLGTGAPEARGARF